MRGHQQLILKGKRPRMIRRELFIVSSITLTLKGIDDRCIASGLKK